MTRSLIEFTCIAGAAAFSLLCCAWVTILPAIGVLWCLGWLK